MRTLLLGTLCFALAANALEPGKPSPALMIQRVAQPPIQLSQYKGKLVLLAFISTTCPHCQDLTRGLIPIAREYEAKGVQIVECAFNPNAGLFVPQFIQTFQPPFPVGFTDNNTAMAYFGRSPNDPSIFYVPHLVFLDREGRVQGDFAGESDFMKMPEANIRAQLEKMLKVGSASSPAKSASKSKTK